MGPHDAGEDLPESPLCAFVLSWECRLNRLNPHQPTWVSGGTQLIVGGVADSGWCRSTYRTLLWVSHQL